MSKPKNKILLSAKYTAVLGVALMFSLPGCTSTSETFDCAPGRGLGCKSISRVNEMMDKQEDKDTTIAKSSQAPSVKPVSGAQTKAIDLAPSKEKVLKVWIAPYEDELGHFYEASVIHLKLPNLKDKGA